MTMLHIALEEGFENDVVVVTVDGVERYRNEDLLTKIQIGLADQFQLDVQPGQSTIEASVLSRNVSGTTTVDVAGDLHVGISLSGDGIRFRSSSDTFGYV
jgi:hypothetical protein